jgi:hypothetical protein
MVQDVSRRKFTSLTRYTGPLYEEFVLIEVALSHELHRGFRLLCVEFVLIEVAFSHALHRGLRLLYVEFVLIEVALRHALHLVSYTWNLCRSKWH